MSELTEVKIGPVFALVCHSCSEPIWHAFGLLNWFGKKVSK